MMKMMIDHIVFVAVAVAVVVDGDHVVRVVVVVVAVVVHDIVAVVEMQSVDLVMFVADNLDWNDNFDSFTKNIKYQHIQTERIQNK